MTKGIYLFWDNKYEQIIYAGKFTGRKRIKTHFHPSKKYIQKINTYIQNHPDRIEPVIFCEFDDISDNDLNQLEKKTIKLFKLNKYKYPDSFVFNFTDGGDGSNGFIQSLNNKINRSKVSTSTGFFRVTKTKKSDCNQGFIWNYFYYENNNRKQIGYVNLADLKQAVEKKGLPWEIIDKKKANECLKFEKTKTKKRKNNNTGILKVCREKSSTCNKGFIWTYLYYEVGKQKKIRRANLKDLEKIVKEKNLPWEIIDEEKAKKSYAEN